MRKTFVILVTWSFKWCSYVLHVVSIKPHLISSVPGFWLVISRWASLRWPDDPAARSPAPAESLMWHVSLPANNDDTVNGGDFWPVFLCTRGRLFFFLTCLLTKCDFWPSSRFIRVLALFLPLAAPLASSPKAISYHTQGVICKDVIV